ncbi:sugar kinase [Microbacterium sp. Au-Mic1]|uniref:sugar kinase n=1 Tax=Microbacterium sp. Au-Mic1 TaxID=2906457 RepID=UPI001E30DAAE|nr:sugar kinase [Microbacterium sp. Au-Mic1]MCE4026196.1 sugar kinase [Microbacterium sp. Au-Mic1]
MPASAHPVATPSAVTFGEALVVLVQNEPGPLEHASGFTRSLGGAEANVAIGLASCGVPTSVITRVGDDGFGRYLRDELHRLGVDTSAIGVDPLHSTGVYFKEVGGGSAAVTDLGAGRSRMHYYRSGSAGAHLSPQLLDEPAVAAALAGAALVHTTGITPALSGSAADAQRALVSALRGRALVSFDLNWRARLWSGRETEGRAQMAGFLRSSDIALAGLDEAEQVFDVSSPEELRRAFPEPRMLVVKNDDGAVVAFDGEERIEVPVPARVEVVEAIGAGDAFASGLLAGILHGLPLTESVAQGHRTAARALTSVADHIAPDPAPRARAADATTDTGPTPAFATSASASTSAPAEEPR